MLRKTLSLLTKIECVLAMRISILWIAFLTRLIVVFDYIAPFIVTINLILLAHLIYRVAILVVEFSCVFIEDIDAFCVCYILELAFVWNINRGGVIRACISVVASCGYGRKQEDYYQDQRYFSAHLKTTSKTKKVRPIRNAPKKCIPLIVATQMLSRWRYEEREKTLFTKVFSLHRLNICNLCSVFIIPCFLLFVNPFWISLNRF